MNRPFHIPLFITAALLLLPGCAVWNPVADVAVQGYVNTVSYFNTFYNAQRLYSEAEDEVLKARRDLLERGGIGKPFTTPSAARQKFQTSIEKNSKVLSFYPDSRWVDGALMMIGKAYYYMDDDVRSERKFLELAVKFPESSLIPESRLWLGRSYLRQKKTELGLKQLEELLAEKETIDPELAGGAAYELGQYRFERKDYREADRYYTLASELVSDDELLTIIYFQMGQCNMELEQYAKAYDAYASARRSSPVYSLIFQAQLQQVKITAMNGRHEEALETLEGMLTDSKNAEYFGSVHFEIAEVMMMQGRKNEAVEKYRYIDTAFVRTEESARSYFLLGKYFELSEGRYDSARVMYNKARVEFPASEITAEAVLKGEMFNKYFDLWKELSKYDSLYTKERDRPLELDTVSVVKDTAAVKDTVVVKAEPKVKKMAKAGKTETKKDSALSVDSLRIKERLQKERERALLLDSLQRTIGRVKFELGGLFFLEIQQPDSAVRWFDDVIDHYASTPYAPRALYTKAEMFRTVLNRPQPELEALYTTLIDRYSESPYANEARKFLGRPLVVAQIDTAAAQFEQAEQLSDAGDHAAAVVSLKRTAERFPLSPYASKSLYTAGWHYEHALDIPDSAVAVYQRLVTMFPSSTYAAKVRGKVMEYDAEKNRIQEEKLEAERKEAEAKKEAEEQKKKPTAPQTPATGTPSDSLSTPNERP